MTRTLFCTTLALAALLTACGDKAEDGDGDGNFDGTGDGSTTTPPFAPGEGEWASDSETVTSDTCNIPDDGEPANDAPMVLATTGEGTFTLSSQPETTDEQQVVFDCTLMDLDFTCDPFTFEQDLSEMSLDAVIHFEQGMSGTFASETHASVHTSMDVSCEGSDCETVETFSEIDMPCAVEVDIETSLVGG